MRLDDDKHELINIEGEDLKKINGFLNNRSEYFSTIKNIVAFLKGSNPAGEAKKPKAAEMIVDTSVTSLELIENFVILLDKLMIEKNHRDWKTNLFDAYFVGAEEIDFLDFIKLNDQLYEAFKYMQKAKDPIGFKIYLGSIKAYYMKYNNLVSRATKIVESARGKYVRKIDKSLKIMN